MHSCKLDENLNRFFFAPTGSENNFRQGGLKPGSHCVSAGIEKSFVVLRVVMKLRAYWVLSKPNPDSKSLQGASENWQNTGLQLVNENTPREWSKKTIDGLKETVAVT